MNAKPKTELNISVFMQKRTSVHGASIAGESEKMHVSFKFRGN